MDWRKVRTPILRKVLRRREKIEKEWIRAEAEAAGVPVEIAEETIKEIDEIITEVKKELAQRMLAYGIEPHVITHLTGLSMKEMYATVE